jgi:hypothetical protein
METLAAESCSNGICAIGCAVGCLVTGGAPVAWGALGGVIGAWAAEPAEVAA